MLIRRKSLLRKVEKGINKKPGREVHIVYLASQYHPNITLMYTFYVLKTHKKLSFELEQINYVSINFNRKNVFVKLMNRNTSSVME